MNMRHWISTTCVALALSLMLLPRTAIGQGDAHVLNTGWVSPPSVTISNNSPHIKATADGYFQMVDDNGYIPIYLDVALFLDGNFFARLATPIGNLFGATSEVAVTYHGTLPPMSPGQHTFQWYAYDTLALTSSAAPYETAQGVTPWNQTVTFSTTTAYPGPVGGDLIRPVPADQNLGVIQIYGDANGLDLLQAQADGEYYSESGSPYLDQSFYLGGTYVGGATPVYTNSVQITGHGPFSNPNSGFTAVEDMSGRLTRTYPNEWRAVQRGTSNVLWDIIVYY